MNTFRITITGLPKKESDARYMILHFAEPAPNKRKRWRMVHGSTTSLSQAARVADRIDGIVVTVGELNRMSAEGWL